MANRYVMTARRRAALRKAQLASARKRRGRKMSPTTKRRVKKAAIVTGGVLAVAVIGREVRTTNTYIYGMARYRTMNNYRDLPKSEMRQQRSEMKKRQRAASFGNGRSTFALRSKRQASRRTRYRGRMDKLGVFGYAYKMSRNTIMADPILNMGIRRAAKTGLVQRAGKSKLYKAYDRRRFVKSVTKTINEFTK